MSESSDTITIRVPKSIKEKLEVLSTKNHMNLNLLINHILIKNVQWDEHLTQMGWLQFEPSTVKEIFKHLDEMEINEIASSIQNNIISALNFIYGKATLENIIDFIEMWMKSTNTPFRHIEDEKTHKFIIRHNIGKNWSSFAIKVCEKFIPKLGFKVENTYVKNDTYSFSVIKQ